jgi:3'-phosphoadenosine 5'-phosphosulfate sulfotransferase (PAPS reductase)/FAD synthetase
MQEFRFIYLGWFSCGVTSAIACWLTLRKYGQENVELYYIDIDSAHPDNDRFVRDCEAWFGVKIKRIRSEKYKDQFDVIEKERYINGLDGAKCTKVLKKDVRFVLEQTHVPTLFNPETPYIKGQVHGFEFQRVQIDRAISFKKDYAYTNPIFPLIEAKLTKEDCAAIITKHGIELPMMYRLGYSNNNCIGCVKGGKGYWNKIRLDFPSYFKRMAESERDLGHSCIKDTFLDDLDPQDGYTPKPVIPECSVVCEDILDVRWRSTEQVLNGNLSIYEA